MNKYNKINHLRQYLSRQKSLDNPGLESARFVMEDYDRMRLQLSVLVGELKVRKRVSAKIIVDRLDNILWEEK
jgi:hypothetical protein